MKPKPALEKIKPLLKSPSFTSRQARDRDVTSATLAYYVKQGEIERIGHGVYRGTNAPKTDEFRWEDLIAAVQRSRGGVICLTSALAVYGLTDEIPRQHWIAIRNGTIHRAGPATKVIRMRNIALGRTMASIGKMQVSIFDQERTIVDAFRFLSRETAIKALKVAAKKRGSAKIDFEKLRSYAKALRVQIEPYVLAVTT